MPDLTYRLNPREEAFVVGWSEYDQLVDELAQAMIASHRRLPDSAGPPVLVGIAMGGVLVTQSLAERLPDHEVWTAAVRPAGQIELTRVSDGVVDRPDAAARGIWLVDEVIDSGRTLRHVSGSLRDAGAAYINGCALFCGTAADEEVLAARRLDDIPTIVLPWRVRRDFVGTARALLAAGPRSSEQIVAELRGLGQAVDLAVIDTLVAQLVARRLVTGDSGRWSWTG